MLVTSLVHSRLDNCNVILAGLPSCDMRRLQLVLNLLIRLVTGARKYDHVTPLLRDHHWLPIAERVEYKLCTLVFRCLQGKAMHRRTLRITLSRRPPSVEETAYDLRTRSR
jgi:hypothetical protein